MQSIVNTPNIEDDGLNNARNMYQANMDSKAKEEVYNNDGLETLIVSL